MEPKYLIHVDCPSRGRIERREGYRQSVAGTVVIVNDDDDATIVELELLVIPWF